MFANALRRIVGRIDVILRAPFLPTGYAIVQVMAAIIPTCGGAAPPRSSCSR